MGSGIDVCGAKLRFFMTNRQSEIVDEFKCAAVTEEIVTTVMNGIKSKAIGSDQISTVIIKTMSSYAIDVIIYLINKFLKMYFHKLGK